jgi:hypothetical protein
LLFGVFSEQLFANALGSFEPIFDLERGGPVVLEDGDLVGAELNHKAQG